MNDKKRKNEEINNIFDELNSAVDVIRRSALVLQNVRKNKIDALTWETLDNLKDASIGLFRVAVDFNVLICGANND